jgi:fatty acid-binding protein DegV
LKDRGDRCGRIALETDSTCDLREAELRKHVAAVIPLHVFGSVGAVTSTAVDFDSTHFFKLFREGGQAAQSSQPSVASFFNVYRDLLEITIGDIGAHLRPSLSTVQTATIGRPRRLILSE